MSRGRIPGSGSAQARILAVLRGLGADMSGLPKSLRAAELAAAAKVNHHSLAKCTGALLAAGMITRCLVQPAKGNKTFEYRIGSGMPPQAWAPLDTRKALVANGPVGKPTPRTTPAPAVSRAPAVVKTGPYPATTTEPDAALLARVQTMSEAEFGGYVAHLARVWAWGRARKAA